MKKIQCKKGVKIFTVKIRNIEVFLDRGLGLIIFFILFYRIK